MAWGTWRPGNQLDVFCARVSEPDGGSDRGSRHGVGLYLLRWDLGCRRGVLLPRTSRKASWLSRSCLDTEESQTPASVLGWGGAEDPVLPRARPGPP